LTDILRKQSVSYEKTRLDILDVSTSFLTLFDLLIVRRLHEYSDATQQSRSMKFFSVAQKLLCHIWGKEYQSASVVVLQVFCYCLQGGR
jgi:hypothetical protein